MALLLGLYMVGVATLAEGSAPRILPPASAGVTANFAIADFDGDQRPDFASVQAGGGTPRESRYWIRLQLSTGSRQTIGLTAPVGGLRLDLQDVNGDHLADLIVSTTWFGRPVAILLNDGQGNFTFVDPSEFPAATKEAPASWSEPSSPINELSAIPPSRSLPKVLQSQSGGFLAEIKREFAFRTADCPHISNWTCTSAGRAPPQLSIQV
jgi:hypothetical protein